MTALVAVVGLWTTGQVDLCLVDATTAEVVATTSELVDFK